MNTYIIVFLGSWLLALLVTPLVIKVAKMFSFMDSPGIRKVHSMPVPRIGGAAVFLPMLVLIISVLFLDNVIGDEFRNVHTKVIVLLSAASFIFVVGLIDDVKGLRARIKLLFQLAAAVMVCAFDIRISEISIPVT